MKKVLGTIFFVIYAIINYPSHIVVPAFQSGRTGMDLHQGQPCEMPARRICHQGQILHNREAPGKTASP